GFQLYYDLGDRQTAPEWLTQLTLSLKQGGTVLWTSPLQINTKNQTFISTNFYTQAVNCGGGYTFQIDQKDVIGPAPATNIYLKVLLYRDDDQPFNPATALQLNCTNGGREINLGWTYPGTAREYDLEWVFIADHEGFTGTTAQQAFQFKEPVRITMAVPYYNHLHFYQNGKLWYRARAVGYHPQFPEHRQLGQWFYTPCSSIAIANQQDDRNWQMQTAFAEDGKTKKVVQYFDGTQRARQSQTNLSTENITVTSETLYDFEGRKSVDILSAPSGAQYNNALTFKPGLNNFAASDPLIVARTSATRKKYHYDNAGAQNSTINTTNGAGLYYSPANTQGTDVEIRKLIPNSEGYVYSQTEYLNDGTGRVKRQSGVGREFRMDGGKATRYFYGSAAPAELKRLFGNTNVGNASHYKKNLVVDANGQVSVSYLDQYDQVIATALAGDKPDALAALPSYIDRSAPPIVVDITANNQRQGDQSVTVHKILNTAPSTNYTLVYDLTAANPSMGELGCPTCVLDLEISVTNPEGELMALGAVPGNQSTSSNRYLRKGISGIGCTPQNIPIQITLTFADIGDYTITKRLVSSELSYEQLKALVTTRADVQTKIQEITNVYNQIDNTKCAICTTQPTACTDAENAIITAFNEIAALDCENIVLQIREDLRQAYLALNPQDVDYEPTQTQIETDARYCQYTLCVKDKDSDVFEKLLARVVNWSSAVAAGLSNPISVDPFFNNSALSGFPSRSAMQTRLNQFVVATFNAQVAVPRPIEYVVNPSSPEYYIDEAGNPANTTVGRHMLYKDLMERRSQLTPEAYAAELL
ncbi:MAG TPA: hypothetical protein DCE81_01280, partial [Cytophagales bacterium]|nr:hypothetical protein [Cytophagales bacterium]